MTKKELDTFADEYCIEKFGAATGNKSVRDAYIDGYNLALNMPGVNNCPICGGELQQVCTDCTNKLCNPIKL